jgi:hypothetical protein
MTISTHNHCGFYFFGAQEYGNNVEIDGFDVDYGGRLGSDQFIFGIGLILFGIERLPANSAEF